VYACTFEANRPNVQFVQDSLATLSLYLPLVQLLQVLWAVLSWYCPIEPDGHIRNSLTQNMKKKKKNVLAYTLPNGQSRQYATAGLFQVPSGSLSCFTNFPLGHCA